MLTAVRSMATRGAVGEPLPGVFSAFDEYNVKFRRGEVSIIGAGAGTGKSVLALALALNMRVPTLYLSADSNAWTMCQRLASMATGDYLTDIELAYQNDRAEQYNQALAEIDWVLFNYQSDLWLGDIREEVDAFDAA